MAVALAVVGSTALLFGVLDASQSIAWMDRPRRIGEAIAGFAVFPLIVIGLFSIGRKFRTARTRATLALVTWSLLLFSSVRHLAVHPASINLRLLDHPYDQPFPQFSLAQDPRTPQDSPNGPLSGVAPLAIELHKAKEADPAPVRLKYDFSPGSDKSLIDLLNHTEEKEYHAVVAEYEKACAARGDDAVLALERVRFIERFADAEDVTIDSASDDLAAAVDYLKGHFPLAPGTVLYEMRNTSDPAFEVKAARFALQIPEWGAEDRAKFLLLRAQSANLKGDTKNVEKYASDSFRDHPTVEDGLLLAKALHASKKDAEALSVLSNPVFADAKVWEKKQEMDLFFDLRDGIRAMALFRAIQATNPQIVDLPETATRLAEAGHIAEARAVLGKLSATTWNRARNVRARFRFELEYGTGEQARDAYRELRATGIAADPLARERVALLAKHPGLGWSWDDLGGLLMLDLLVLAAILLPLLLLAPIHYGSLLRSGNAGTPSPVPPAWGLREAWMVFGAFTLSDALGVWWLRPDFFRSWWSKAVHEGPITPELELSQLSLRWGVLLAVLAILLWRKGQWSLLGPGRWGVGKAIGVSLGIAFALRMCLGVYIVVFPKAAGVEIASVQSMTQQFCILLEDRFGPTGLIAVVAILVPIIEELMFRGVLLQAISKYLPFGVANALQALLFGAAHGSLWLLPFFVVFGIVSGCMARQSRGLLPSMLMHGFNNLASCLGILVLQRHHSLPGM